jgi:SAM-dependent methyltransferase
VLSIYLICRIPSGPEQAFRECRRVLKRGGCLILATPLNWKQHASWKRFGDAEAFLELFYEHGFEIETWFDDVPYIERVDARGSVDSWRNLIVRARAK